MEQETGWRYKKDTRRAIANITHLALTAVPPLIMGTETLAPVVEMSLTMKRRERNYKPSKKLCYVGSDHYDYTTSATQEKRSSNLP